MTENIEALTRATVVDRDGDKVGGVGQLFLDDATGQPSWVTVSTGFFGSKETFIPLADAQIAGEEIRVPYEKDFIKDAPNMDVDQHLTPEEEQELYRYYGVGEAAPLTQTGERDAAVADRDAVAPAADRVAEGDAVVAHEERLNVGTETRETGRARLRKYVVEETQSVEVPVQREELRIERETLDGRPTDYKIGEHTDEAEQVVTLHEERPVVSKETVETERVSVGKDVITENQQVSESVAKERIEVEQDGVQPDNR